MEQNKSSVGSIIGTIIIIALIILGGLYFWGKQVEESKNIQNLTTDMTTPQQTADTSEAGMIKSSVSSSDDLSSIDTDLQNTNTTNLSPETAQ